MAIKTVVSTSVKIGIILSFKMIQQFYSLVHSGQLTHIFIRRHVKQLFIVTVYILKIENNLNVRQ